MSPAERAEYIRSVVDGAPPLTDDQAERLRSLLAEAVTSLDDAVRAVSRGA